MSGPGASTLVVDDIQGGALTARYDYDGSNNLIYYGLALPGSLSSAAVWSIRKMTYSGTNVTLLAWAGGNGQFANIWDNRAALSYS